MTATPTRKGDAPGPPLTVAQCCFTGSWGGLEMLAVEHARAAAARGHRAAALCRRGSPVHGALGGAALEVVPVPARDYVAPRAVAAIRHWVRRVRPDILHAHRGTDLWLLRQATWGLRHPPRLVWSNHVFTCRKRDPLHRWLYRGVARAVVYTAEQRLELLRHLPLQPQRVTVIPNSIDPGRFATGSDREGLRRRMRAALGLADAAPLLGVIGRLDPKKGQDDAVRALAATVERHPRACLVLIGAETAGEPGEQGRLERLARDLGVADRVRFLGHRDDVPALLAALDVFMMPSHCEAFGLVLIEAMAAGVPAIATRAGAPPEILEDGRAGLLVRPRDPGDLAAAIDRLASDPAAAAALIAAARRRVETTYASPAKFDRVERLYREVASEPAGARRRPLTAGGGV